MILKGFSEKKDGNMKVSSESGGKFRAEYFSRIGLLPINVVMAGLSDGNKVAVVTEDNRGQILQGYDGLVTNEPEIILGVTAADCLPIYFWNKQNTVIGIAHAGWRGVKAEIVKEVIKIFTEKYSCNPSDIFAEVGPHIKDCHFEIQDDLVETFSADNDCLRNENGHKYLDLSKIIEKQLISVGLNQNNINRKSECTFCSEKYFSYRRDKPNEVEAMVAHVTIKK